MYSILNYLYLTGDYQIERKSLVKHTVTDATSLIVVKQNYTQPERIDCLNSPKPRLPFPIISLSAVDCPLLLVSPCWSLFALVPFILQQPLPVAMSSPKVTR